MSPLWFEVKSTMRTRSLARWIGHVLVGRGDLNDEKYVLQPCGPLGVIIVAG